jgi:hypothetical protein
MLTRTELIDPSINTFSFLLRLTTIGAKSSSGLPLMTAKTAANKGT